MRSKGKTWESLAAAYLERRNLHLIISNYACRLGEIDLILEHEQTLVFCEVRYRKRAGWGSGADSVDYRKQRKIILTAGLYLAQHPQRANAPCRFDVLSIGETPSGPKYDWIQDAFQA